MNIRAFAITYMPHIKRVMALCVAGIVLSLLLYAVFLLEAVAHTAARAQAQERIDSLSSEVSALEMQYLSLTRTMTPQRASSLGFVAPVQVTTVYESKGALSFHELR